MSDEAQGMVSKHSELRLSRWLRRELDLLGGLDCVRQYGARQVLDVMHERLLEWDLKEGTWRPQQKFENPAGFLRWALRQEQVST